MFKQLSPGAWVGFVLLLSGLTSAQIARADGIPIWSAADQQLKFNDCVKTLLADIAKAKAGDDVAKKAYPTDSAAAAKCLVDEQVMDWYFYHSYETDRTFPYQVFKSIDDHYKLRPDWIKTQVKANELEAHCNDLPYLLEGIYCNMALADWWMLYGTADVTAILAEAEYARIDAGLAALGDQADAQIKAMPKDTEVNRQARYDRLGELADFWFEDGPNYIDLRDSQEKSSSKDPGFYVQGFRLSLLALQEQIAMYPTDASTISTALWLLGNIDQGDMDLATFRNGGKPVANNGYSDRVLKMAEQYEPANTQNFEFYAAVLDNFQVGAQNWPLVDLALAQSYMDYYKHIADRAGALSVAYVTNYAQKPGQFPGQLVEAMVDISNSVIRNRVLVTYFDHPALFGGSQAARAARMSKGKLPRYVILTGPGQPTRPVNGRAVATYSDIESWLAQPTAELVIQ